MKRCCDECYGVFCVYPNAAVCHTEFKLNWRSAMEVNYVKLAAANQQLELYANTGKPLNKAAALYIVSYINCVLKSTVRTDPESFSVQGGST